MMVAGLVTSTTGAYNKSKTDKAAYEYQAQVQKNNAQLGEWQAKDAIERGQQAENAHRMKVAQMKGSQRASMAARGLDLTEGSALNVLSDTDFMGDMDALVIRDNAAREAWGLREKAKGNKADSMLLQGRANAENPTMAATSSLLTGAGSVASSWYSYNKTTKA
jgi:hypothetical protein